MKAKTIVMSVMSVLVLAAFAGCGGKGVGDKTETEQELAKAERVKEGTIEVYIPKGKNTDYLVNAMTLYNKKYDTKLELKPVDVAPAIPMVQKITPKLVADEEMPELIFLQDSNAGSVFEKFESSFYSAEEYGFVKEFGKDFYPAKMNMLANIAPSKKTYGFPNDWGNASMFYNADAFKEAGVDMTTIKTWDQLLEAGRALKEKTGKKLLFMRDSGDTDLVKVLTEQQGVSLIDKDGNLNLLDSAVLNAYKMVQQLQDEDLVAYGNAKDYMVIGQDCGVIIAGGWLASYQSNDNPDDAGKWRIAAVPDFKEGKNYAPMSGGSSYYVPKKSKNAAAALQFISFALTDREALEGYLELSGLPANRTVYDSPAAQKEFPYYGNQQILVTLDEISQNSLEGYAFPYSADLDNYIEAASYDIQKNGISVEEALQKQAKEFAAKYTIKVN